MYSAWMFGLPALWHSFSMNKCCSSLHLKKNWILLQLLTVYLLLLVSFRPRASNEDGESRSLPSSSSSSSTPPPAFDDIHRSAPSDRQTRAQLPTAASAGVKTANTSSRSDAIRWVVFIVCLLVPFQLNILWLGIILTAERRHRQPNWLSAAPNKWSVWKDIKSSG